jgi:hypothetical protein
VVILGRALKKRSELSSGSSSGIVRTVVRRTIRSLKTQADDADYGSDHDHDQWRQCGENSLIFHWIFFR